MKRQADLYLLSVTLRLKPGEVDTHEAAKQWEKILGASAEGSEVKFTNARMEFVSGVDGKPEGIIGIRIGVKGSERYRGIFSRARQEGCGFNGSRGTVEMLGVTFSFVQTDGLDRSML
jgi:hypothetical protein